MKEGKRVKRKKRERDKGEGSNLNLARFGENLRSDTPEGVQACSVCGRPVDASSNYIIANISAGFIF